MSRASVFGLLAACFVAVSCTSAGARSAGTFSSVENTHKSLIAARDQVNKTAQSLRKLLDQTGDLRNAYKEFSGNVDRMNQNANEVEKRANDLRAKRSEYLREWTREAKGIRNEDIAQLAAARQQEIDADFTALTESMATARAAFIPYRQDLNDIRTYLKNDLTATGLQSIRPTAERILAGGATVNDNLDDADAALNAVAAKLAPKM